MLAKLLGAGGSGAAKVLPSLDAQGVAQVIRNGTCKNIIVMSGAGISVSAGIPDFRSPGTGLYYNLQKFNLPEPTAIFNVEYFKTNPKPFMVLAKEMFPGNYKATKAHYFIRLLNEKGVLLRDFTQNIDTLELVAEIPEEKCVFAHGSFASAHCVACKAAYTAEFVKEHIFADEVPVCTSCNGLVKPDIVFFGENLPLRFFEQLEKDFPQCDLLIIMGTSLSVQPFCKLVDMVRNSVPRLLINREKVGSPDPIMVLLYGVDCTGLLLDTPNNVRDVFMQGDCDSGCQILADLLGWGEDLRALCVNAAPTVLLPATPQPPPTCAASEPPHE
eukprot:TRINITY_DN1338_c0_g1_i2.p1 TRINITY_DN1338_c0_g1~~TRINITY_DN1338_c0_g1_i2.p1  ORF type:complete len:330 (+),score=56.52 TRINITY_DN1338_c0_g1_i2:736-1725(+)